MSTQHNKHGERFIIGRLDGKQVLIFENKEPAMSVPPTIVAIFCEYGQTTNKPLSPETIVALLNRAIGCGEDGKT